MRALFRMATAKATFRDLYCRAKQCPVERFERRFFRHGLYRRSLLLGLLVRWLSPSFFEPEFRLIRQLAVTTTREEFRAEIEDYRWEIERLRSWPRKSMRLRFSGQRLMRYAALLPTM